MSPRFFFVRVASAERQSGLCHNYIITRVHYHDTAAVAAISARRRQASTVLGVHGGVADLAHHERRMQVGIALLEGVPMLIVGGGYGSGLCV